MTEPVHILVTCRKPELLPAATLVFRTLRVGFPAAPIRFTINRPNEVERLIRTQITAIPGDVTVQYRTTRHDFWIKELLSKKVKPFWICDTDVIFFKPFEHVSDGSAIAGVRTPDFYEPWTRTQYRERLQTCLMRIDPAQFKKSALEYKLIFPLEPFQPQIEFVLQQWQAERNGTGLTTHFYDTLAMAWHAFGGQEFTEEQMESFSHLNCATYADLIAPSVDFDMIGAHQAVYADINNARGLWPKQFEWFRNHAHKPQV